MADNYLEKRYEEVFGNTGAKTVIKKSNPSLDSLLLRNRSHRAFSKLRTVTEDELKKIISVNNKIPSARNQQILRFRIVNNEKECEAVIANIKMGAALPDEQLPAPGSEPAAYIVVCSVSQENRYVDIDLGISLQSMALKAVESGLNATIVCAFSKENVKDSLSLEYEPLAILAIGKGQDKIQLLSVEEGQSLSYYRKDGIHYVPKISIDELIIH